MPRKRFLSADEQEALDKALKESTNYKITRWIKVVQLYYADYSIDKISSELKISPQSVYRIVGKYEKGKLNALLNLSYPGNHRNLTIEQEKEFISPFMNQVYVQKTDLIFDDVYIAYVNYVKNNVPKRSANEKTISRRTVVNLLNKYNLLSPNIRYSEDDVTPAAKREQVSLPPKGPEGHPRNKEMLNALDKAQHIHDSYLNPGAGNNLAFAKITHSDIEYIKKEGIPCDPSKWKENCQKLRKEQHRTYTAMTADLKLSVNSIKKYANHDFDGKKNRDLELGYLEVFSNYFNASPFEILGIPKPETGSLQNPLSYEDTDDDWRIKIVMSHLYFNGREPLNAFQSILFQIIHDRTSRSANEINHALRIFPVLQKALDKKGNEISKTLKAHNGSKLLKKDWNSNIMWWSEQIYIDLQNQLHKDLERAKTDDERRQLMISIEQHEKNRPEQYDKFQPILQKLEQFKTTKEGREVLELLSSMCLLNQKMQKRIANLFTSFGLTHK